MHLLPPMYSTTRKHKSKRKHRTAVSADKARRNAESWQQLLEKYDIKPTAKVRKTVQSTSRFNPIVSAGPVLDPKRTTNHIPSVDTGVGIAAKPADKVYTGDKCLGVAILHKSCLQPVFNTENAKDIAKMRR